MVVELNTQVSELSDSFIQQIIGTSTGEQARAWATSFIVDFANIPNPTFANVPDLPDQTSYQPSRIHHFYPLFGNALGASQAVGLGLAPEEKIGD
ncbi:hypothetical protein YC2023_099407 [Brassica napus]